MNAILAIARVEKPEKFRTSTEFEPGRNLAMPVRLSRQLLKLRYVHNCEYPASRGLFSQRRSLG